MKNFDGNELEFDLHILKVKIGNYTRVHRHSPAFQRLRKYILLTTNIF